MKVSMFEITVTTPRGNVLIRIPLDESNAPAELLEFTESLRCTLLREVKPEKTVDLKTYETAFAKLNL